jgi:polyisoprenyl-phosphate glycosyltransferase
LNFSDISPRTAVKLTVVAPCYNEAEVLETFVGRTLDVCRKCAGSSFELILVDDGSKDGTWELIRQMTSSSSNIVGVNLARNQGHQIAVTAGLALSRGDRVLIIDADLQDPPQLLVDMMAKMDEGYDVVYGQRQERQGETIFKKASASLFYRLLRTMTQVDIPRDTGDFRLVNRQTVDLLNQMPERQRFLRGMVAWLGGRQTPLLYVRDKRYAGETKYTIGKMLRLGIDAVTGFSAVPLRFATISAILAVALATAFLCYTILSFWLFNAVPGWASTLTIMLFFFAAQLASLGIIGEYIGRIYVQGQGRPLYLIREVVSSEAGPRKTVGTRAGEKRIPDNVQQPSQSE